MGTKWLGNALSQEELWKAAENQEYVWVKLPQDSGVNFITTDEVSLPLCLHTVMFKVSLRQEDYGKTWALSKDELN